MEFIKFFFGGVYGSTISGIVTTIIFDRFSGVLNLLKKLIIHYSFTIGFCNH